MFKKLDIYIYREREREKERELTTLNGALRKDLLDWGYV